MSTNADKPMFSIKDLLYFLALFGGFCIQYFTIKLQIHDAVTSIDTNKETFKTEVAGMRTEFVGMHKQVDEHTKQISTLEKNFIRLNLEAVKQKDPELEPE